MSLPTLEELAFTRVMVMYVDGRYFSRVPLDSPKYYGTECYFSESFTNPYNNRCFFLVTRQMDDGLGYFLAEYIDSTKTAFKRHFIVTDNKEYAYEHIMSKVTTP